VSPEGVLIEDPTAEAVRAFQEGRDREGSFRQLVDTCYPQVRAYFARRVFSTEECLELTQETFLRIYRGLDGFRHQALFRTWMFRIAQTTYLAWLRRQKREVEAQRSPAVAERIGGSTSDHPGWDEHEPVGVSRETPLDGVLRKEARERLAQAVGALPEQERRCMTLRVYHDLSHQEIADFLGLAVGTVKAHLHHAREKLRGSLHGSFGSIDV